MKATRVYYEGRVQGVGFRWTVKTIAREFEVSGTVRNLDDGRVELVAAGPDLEPFLRAIEESSLAGHIQKITREDIEIPESMRGFHIVP